VRLGTPAGVVPVSVDRDAAGDLTTVSLERAARRITVSTVLVPLPAPSTADLSRATLVGSGIEGQIA
jgi:hypothetical protein